jgi:uncharacterized protein
MKRLLVCMFALAISAFASVAQEASLGRYITVSGSAGAWVEPDIAVWNVRIEKSGGDLDKLREASDVELAGVQSAAQILGIPLGDIRTGRISILKVHERDKSGNLKGFSHYSMRRTVTIEQRDYDQVGELTKVLMRSADLNVSVGYRSTALDSVRLDLKVKAVLAAHEKAVAMAHVLGMSVGEPTIISEYPIITNYREERDRQMVEVRSSAQVLQPEDIRVEETVYVRFELRSGQ